MKRNLCCSGNLMLSLMLMAIMGISLFWCNQKEGMFIDEIYTYGLSNSLYAPFIKDVKGGDVNDRCFSREDVLNYLEVGEDDAFAFKSVYYNQTRDVHPPLHYWLMNFTSSLFPFSHSKWIGLGLNVFLFLLTIGLLYVLSVLLFGEGRFAFVAPLLYGVSQIGLSTMLMIRMYMLMTLWTVVFSICVVIFLKGNTRWYVCAALSAVVCLGLLTQYYFVYFAFFVTAFVGIRLFFVEKKRKDAIIFSLCSLMGVCLMLLIYPSVLRHLFAKELVSGTSVVANMLSLKGMFFNLMHFGKPLLLDNAPILLFGLFLVIFLIYSQRQKVGGEDRDGSGNKSGLSRWFQTLILPTMISAFFICLTSPAISLRYIYSLMPICFLFFPLLLMFLPENFGQCREKKATILSCAVVVLMLGNFIYPFIWHPSYLFYNQKEYMETMEDNDKSACVYVEGTDGASITQDLLLLSKVDSFFVSKFSPSRSMLKFINLSNADRLLVFVNTDKVWGDGADVSEVLKKIESETPYSQPKFLFSNGLSQTFVLTRETR